MIKQLLILSLIMIQVGCFNKKSNTDQKQTSLEVLTSNRDKWINAKNGEDEYTFEISKYCFCFGAARLSLLFDGEDNLTSFYAFDNFNLLIDNYEIDENETHTVEQLFLLVENALQNADAVSVEYHPEYGIPILIDVDWNELAIDDEVVIKIEDFYFEGWAVQL